MNSEGQPYAEHISKMASNNRKDKQSHGNESSLESMIDRLFEIRGR